jgi:plastocyanin
MKRQKTTGRTVLAIILMLLAVALIFAQDTQSTKKPYQPNGAEGSLVGRISLLGTPPRLTQIDMSANPDCYKANPNPNPFTEFLVVSDGRVANVLIYVKSGEALAGLSFETPTTTVVLDLRGCRYVPHVLGVQVNQTLEIKNSDDMYHNVHAVPKNNLDWNQTLVPSTEPLKHRFIHSEIAVPLKNNQAPWMKAYVGVFAHPFFAVSDRQGAFTIDGLPPGNYTIGAWQEEFGEKTFEVTIYAGSRQSLDVKLDMADRRSSR